MSEDKHHSEEVLRYLRGEMSNSEAHDFERRALNDPFLQDALEGASRISPGQFEHDLIQIGSGPKKHHPKTPVIWRIAAVISLLIVSGVAFWMIQDIDRPEEISRTDTPEDQIKAAENEHSKDADPISEEKVSSSPNDENAPKGLPKPIAARQLTEQKESEQITIPEMEEPEITLDGTELADENIQQPAMDLETSDETQAPKVEEKAVTAKRSKSFFMTQSAALDSIDQASNSQADDVEEDALQEVVVSGYGDYDNEPEGFADAYPRPDFRSFREYLEENLRYPEEAKNKSIEGRVVLQLTISPVGKITNIDVKRSLGHGCDKEAIRLINEGPTWEPASRDGINVETKIRIRIKFSLD